MQSHAVLPATAPFAADQITQLNRVMKTITPAQRQWLSGFLAGLEAAQAQPAANVPAAPPARKLPLTILYATESGNAESLAGRARQAAGRAGFAAKVLDMADASPADLKEVRNLLVIASTWGEGDPPQRAAPFFKALMAEDAPRLPDLRFSVLALGDRAYANFCLTGQQIDARLAELGGQRTAPRVDCDVEFEAPAKQWLDGALRDIAATESAATDAAGAVIHVDFARGGTADAESGAAHDRNSPFAAEITERVNLNGSRSTAETWHLELSLEGSGIAYEPGDALAVLPRNEPALVEAIAKAAGIVPDTGFAEALEGKLDITTLTRPMLAAYADLTGEARLKDVAAQTAFLVAGRHVIDLLESFPHRLTQDQLAGLLRPLAPRSYSIASSRKAVDEAAHLLVSAVRYDAHGRRRHGVASVDLADRRKAGGTVEVFLKPNAHFRLPADPARKVVMIGPGTGVAPFRGFLQERDATGATGGNWLFFGGRNYTHDFLYQLEWQDWLQRGVLTHLDVAFSRDQPEKVYVQHRLWQQRQRLFAWIEDGALLYVCGDAKAMAKDVHAMLARVIADQGGLSAEAAEARLDALARERRYLRDVY
ncbi:MAG: flavodoxin domain-containing protein [Rhodospirillales bacterium]|nr:flavodoxin domain-containing protein [Rhodospirillales bacterium]